MRRNLITFLLALACSLLFTSSANATDQAYGYTGIDVDEAAGVVRGYHRTEVDYSNELYYTPRVCGSLYKDDVEQVRSCHTGMVSATSNTQALTTAGQVIQH